MEDFMVLKTFLSLAIPNQSCLDAIKLAIKVAFGGGIMQYSSAVYKVVEFPAPKYKQM